MSETGTKSSIVTIFAIFFFILGIILIFFLDQFLWGLLFIIIPLLIGISKTMWGVAVWADNAVSGDTGKEGNVQFTIKEPKTSKTKIVKKPETKKPKNNHSKQKLIVIILILVVSFELVTITYFGNSTDSTSEEQRILENKRFNFFAEATKSNPASIGQSVMIKDLAIRITDVDYPKTLECKWYALLCANLPEYDNKIMVLTFQFENRGKEQITIYQSLFEIIIPSNYETESFTFGKEISPVWKADDYELINGFDWITELDSGKPASGKFIFQVPQKNKYILQIGDGYSVIDLVFPGEKYYLIRGY